MEIINKPKRCAQLLLLLGCGFWLGGCVNVGQKQNIIKDAAPVQIGSNPLYDQDWELEAKFSLLYQKKRTTVFVQWRQKGEALSLTLSGPMGHGLTRIRVKNPSQISVWHKGRSRNYTKLSDAIATELGWPFPVEHAQYWVTGRPNPNHWHRNDPEFEARTHWVQANWRVSIEKEIPIEQTTHKAPKKIRLTYPADAQQPEISVDLISKTWRATSAADH